MKYLIYSLLFFSLLYSHENKTVKLSQSEQEFLRKHPNIILGTDKSWKPYIIVNSNNNISGYDNDVLTLINQISGSNFQIQAGNWAEMQNKAKNKQIDGLTTGVAYQERKSYLNFSKSYISMQQMIITTKSNPDKISHLDNLIGKTIAIHASNLVDQKTARQFPQSHIIQYNTIEEVVESVVTGKASAMFGNGATIYFANQLGFPNLKLAVSLGNSMKLSFGVRNDWPEAITIINKSLDKIGEQKLLELKKKWFFIDNIKNKKAIFSTIEKLYLENKKEIRMCIDPQWMPYERIKNGRHIGITAEYIEQIQKQLPIPIRLINTKEWIQSLEYIKDKKCDFLSLAMRTPSRDKYLYFTTPYLSVPLVITTKLNVPFISDFESIKNKKVGITKGYAFVELLREKYPKLDIVEVDNIKSGLQQVSDNKLFGYIGTLATVGHQFQKNFIGELKISGKFDEKWIGSIAVKKTDTLLLDILQKSLNSIDENERKKILNKWIAIKYEQNIDYSLFIEIILVILFIILLIIYWNFKLKREISKRKIIEYQLQELNNTLEKRIAIAIKDVNTKNSKLKESIDNFKYVLDVAMETIVFYDYETRTIIDLNKAGIKMLGYQNKKDIINRHINEFILESELDKVNKSILEDISEPYELILIKNDGTLIYTINKAKNIIIDGKKIRMTTLINLTDIKRKEKILREQTKLAQMGEMISMIAHQWRQPLGAINSAIFAIQTKIVTNKYNLDKRKGQEEFLKFLTTKHNYVDEYVQFLSTTIDDFRNFFKPDKEKEFIPLTLPIQRALQIVQASLENKGIRISRDFETDGILSLYQNEMMQVILNIIKNSEDNFSEKNIRNPEINIITKQVDDTFTISICDNGGGIKDNIITKIFEPYFSTKDEKNGTGLGLYMSKIIIEEHNNGKLNVSNTTVGACFEIILYSQQKK